MCFVIFVIVVDGVEIVGYFVLYLWIGVGWGGFG